MIEDKKPVVATTTEPSDVSRQSSVVVEEDAANSEVVSSKWIFKVAISEHQNLIFFEISMNLPMNPV